MERESEGARLQSLQDATLCATIPASLAHEMRMALCVWWIIRAVRPIRQGAWVHRHRQAVSFRACIELLSVDAALQSMTSR